MDKVDYYFQNYQKSMRELESAKDLIVNYKPISEDAFLYSLSTQQALVEDRVQATTRHDKMENLALDYRQKFKVEEREYEESLFEKYCNLKADLDFFVRAIYNLDDIIRPIMIDLVLHGETWEELQAKHNVSRMTISRYRKKALKDVREFYSFAGKSTHLTG